jgi:hypothetical protein
MDEEVKNWILALLFFLTAWISFVLGIFATAFWLLLMGFWDI